MDWNEIKEGLQFLAEQWRKGELNAPYGYDENGNQIATRNGVQCAFELEERIGWIDTDSTREQYFKENPLK